MSSYALILTPVLYVFSVVVIGVILRRTAFIDRSADTALTRLILNLFFPCLIFSKIVGNPALDNLANLAWAPAIGFGCVVGGYVITYFLAPLMGIKKPEARGAFSMTAGSFNYGFVPIPIAMSLFDDQTIGTLFLHNVGVELALWSFGIALLTGSRERLAIKHLLSPPLCTIVLGICIHFSGLATYIPAVVNTTTTAIGHCAIPISLLMIGMTIGNYVGKFPGKDSLRIAIPGCALRLAILPALMLLLALSLPISDELRRVMILQVAMPSAVFPIVLAEHYKSDAQTALRVVLSTSLLAIITLPLWLAFGLRLIGEQ